MMANYPPGLHHSVMWDQFKNVCAELIRNGNHKDICEIGAGRDPLFTLEEIEELGVNYTVVDVSAEELELLPEGFHALVADLCEPAGIGLGEQFDFMLSRTAAEHMPDGAMMHKNVLSLLRPGGEVIHLFPTLYHPIFAVNRILPGWVSDVLLNRYDPRAKPKFKAYYSMCRGPSRRILRRLTEIGYIVAEHRPFYGHDYFKKVGVLRRLDDRVSAWAARRRNPYLTTYAWLRLRKPAAFEGAVQTH
jgi:SAM-dependent methyltransferase